MKIKMETKDMEMKMEKIQMKMTIKMKMQFKIKRKMNTTIKAKITIDYVNSAKQIGRRSNCATSNYCLSRSNMRIVYIWVIRNMYIWIISICKTIILH